MFPKKLLREMAEGGARVEKVEGEPLHAVYMNQTDEAYAVYQAWVDTQDDPLVDAACAPPAALVGTVLAPVPALYGPIQIEANSIIQHMAPLNRDAFVGPLGGLVAPLAGPMAAPAIHVQVHHSRMSLAALLREIQHPSALYPTITGLGLGSYICTLRETWANGVVSVALFRV
jgi:hypothetical protein